MTIAANEEAMLVPVGQVSVLLGGLSRSSVYSLVENGDLERVKLGARCFVTRSSIDVLVERLREEAAVREQDRAARRKASKMRIAAQQTNTGDGTA
jgi:hypothetical protein